MGKYRTHTCNELNKTNIGETVKLAGWVHSIRDHGGLIFVDLRDNYGITQCVLNSNDNNDLVNEIARTTVESVVFIEGLVVERAKGTANLELPTGEIEIKINEFAVDSRSDQIPFQVADENQNYPEDLRLKYRFLDLRTKRMHKNIQFRDDVIQFLRKFMLDKGFHEFQTPILTSSSPEGARDFLVPSRIHPGKFYALPQAPQQFKQLLMVSGFDKYFQIAPCFRDEGLRADRLLYFYQLDMEMSFATQEDVFAVMEPLFYNTFAKFRPDRKISQAPFQRLTHAESMLKYGIDKPDLRNPIEICDVTNIFRNSEFAVFANAIKNYKKIVVRAIPAPQVADKPRSFFDKMVEFAVEEGAKGLGYIIFTKDGEAKGPVAKYLDKDRLEKLKQEAKLNDGDALFFTCDEGEEAAKLAGKIRIKLGKELCLIDKDEYKFCWIVDFPMFELNEETGALDFAHNPFSMPQGGMDALLNTEDPLDIRAFQYDLACNGYELLSGAVRNHKPEIMYKAFEMVGYSKETVDAKFGGMISAFKYGAPPHAGCAPGIDRIIMLLLDEENLREVTAFPTNGKGEDLLMGAPGVVSDVQLRELHIQLSEKAKENIKK